MRSLIIVALLVALPCSAERASVAPTMTGDSLLKLLGAVDPATVPWTPDSILPSRAAAAEFRHLANGEFVTGYIQAVLDATEGKEWCWSQYKPKPDELVADARYRLAQMPEAQLKRSAVDLLAEVWHSKFPCSAQRRKP